MSLYLPPFNGTIEPNETNVRTWMDALWSKCMPIEQARACAPLLDQGGTSL